ncbi:MAG TPA: DNA polymerase III subunit delta [Negativicutes bacterium]|nr:DNA polymerase III subunit delta [Negativicutes bacterium]
MANATKKAPQVYLFYGEEGLLVRQLANKVIEATLTPEDREFNLITMESDPGIPELLHMVESAPFFGDHKVVVIRNTKLFQAARRKAAAAEESDDEENADAGGEAAKDAADSTDPRLLHLLENMPSYTTLVFTAAKADKRRKLMKVVAENGQIRELNPFRPMEEREIRSWVEDRLAELGKRMHREAMDHLFAVISTMSQVSRGFLSSELEKAALFAGEDPLITKKALEEVMASVPEVSAFAMTDALARRNVAQALSRLEELFVSKEPPLKIIGLLAYNVRRWWQVRQVIDRRGTEAEMVASLGAKSGSPGMVNRVIGQSRSFRDASLKQALLTLADANVASRSGGDPKPYLERVLIELCR